MSHDHSPSRTTLAGVLLLLGAGLACGISVGGPAQPEQTASSSAQWRHTRDGWEKLSEFVPQEIPRPPLPHPGAWAAFQTLAAAFALVAFGDPSEDGDSGSGAQRGEPSSAAQDGEAD